MRKISYRQILVSKDKYDIKCPYEMRPEYVTVHNTANDASAENEIMYMINNNNQVSFHYAVDDKEAVQGVYTDRNTWNAGDGANGDGNRKSIAVEICYSKSGGDRFIEAEKNTAQVVADLLKGWDLGLDRVRKHQDWSNKYCPHRTLDMGWERFLKMVEDCYNEVEIQEQKEKEKTIDELAQEVLLGKYGNGEERKQKLGDKYNEVQNRVNEIINGIEKKPNIDELALAVIRGEYGNGQVRKERLGNLYDEVQAKVNELLK